jgi:hypothetical protein
MATPRAASTSDVTPQAIASAAIVNATGTCSCALPGSARASGPKMPQATHISPDTRSGSVPSLE